MLLKYASGERRIANAGRRKSSVWVVEVGDGDVHLVAFEHAESRNAVTRPGPVARLAPPMDAAGLPALIDAIRHLHGVEAIWLESVPVVETHEGRTVWAGEVQVFALEHPKAKRVYAWSHETSAKKRRFHVVLGIPPVTGPERAVRVAVMSEGARPR